MYYIIVYYVGYNNENVIEIERKEKGRVNINKIYANINLIFFFQKSVYIFVLSYYVYFCSGYLWNMSYKTLHSYV